MANQATICFTSCNGDHRSLRSAALRLRPNARPEEAVAGDDLPGTAGGGSVWSVNWILTTPLTTPLTIPWFQSGIPNPISWMESFFAAWMGFFRIIHLLPNKILVKSLTDGVTDSHDDHHWKNQLGIGENAQPLLGHQQNWEASL